MERDAAHEAGHAFGLGHPGPVAYGAVMHSGCPGTVNSGGGTAFRDPQSADFTNYRVLYPDGVYDSP